MTTAFTIGYGGRKPDDFVKLLAANGVKTVVDVRIRPDRASLGSYAKSRDGSKGIAGLLATAGIGYVSLPELGNPFLDHDDWRPLYAEYFPRVASLLLHRLTPEIPAPICLLCAEKRVAECHRRLIADYLERERGWEFKHIE